jgi:hypothetical protein
LELLDVWEAGRRRSAAARAAGLLAAMMDARPAEIDDWPLGKRDARLLDVLVTSFDGRVAGTTLCEACGEALEVNVEADALRAAHAETGDEVTLDASDGRRFRARPPTNADLRRAERCAGVDDARRVLLECCGAGDLPAEQTRELAALLADADPQADIRLALPCPGCGEEGELPLDLADHVWRRVELTARRLVGEVHALALAYGWSEPDVLALPPSRRRLYLELASS